MASFQTKAPLCGLLSVLLCFCSLFVSGQDSLKNLLHKDLPDTTKIEMLLSWSRAQGETHPDSAKPYINKALQLATALDLTKWKGNVYMEMGNLREENSQLDSARKYYQKAIEEFNKTTASLKKAKAHNNIGITHDLQGDYPEALDHYFRAKKIYQKNDDQVGLANEYSNIGTIFSLQGNYSKALDYFLKSLDLENKMGRRNGVAESNQNLGNLYFNQGELGKALEHYQKSLSIQKELGDQGSVASLYNNIGLIHAQRGELGEALSKYHRSLKIKKREKDKSGVATSYNNIGSLYNGISGIENVHLEKVFPKLANKEKSVQQILLDSATFYQNKALSVAEKIDDKNTMIQAYHGLGKIAKGEQETRKAREYFSKAAELSQQIGSKKEEFKARKELAGILATLGNYSEAYENHQRYAALKDSVYNARKSKQMGRMQMKYEYEKKLLRQQKEQEKQKAITQERRERQQVIILAVSSGLGLVVLFSLFLLNRFRVIRKQKRTIEDKKKEVDEAYLQLHQKNQEITDSIHYASRIQEAILTSPDYLEATLGEHFVYFNPKEVVSGDFYWAYHDKKNNLSIWVAADCTGHGVPGAFMSMIGNRLFNETVLERGVTDPGKVLDQVRDGVIQALGQSGEEDRKDGMDAAVCVLDQNTNTLQFAGANNPVYIIRKDEQTKDGEQRANADTQASKELSENGFTLLEIKANKQPIGPPEGEMSPFSTQTIQLQPGDTLYTFSDGFADQFGGPKGKKYRYKPFKKLLLSLQDQPMAEQKHILEKEFQEWKNNQEQVDDVVVIGVQAFK